MIRTILIDDEEDSLTSLQYDINNYCPDVQIIACYSSPLAGLEAIKSQNPELVFLDIQMPEMNGFELLESLDTIDFQIIFVTAFDGFALRAFDFNAVDYLLKPVQREKLVRAVQKITKKNSGFLDTGDIKAILHNIGFQQQNRIKSIAIPTAQGYLMIHSDEISHLRAENNYTWVYCIDGKKHLVSRQIKKLEEHLPKPDFFRTHKSYVVNIRQTVRYVRGQGGYLVLKDGSEVPVSRNRKSGLMTVLNIS